MYVLSPDHRQHVLDITHDTFAAIKSAQGILVDFAGFPAKMIDLLERCLVCPPGPRFQAVLCDNVFQIVEVNDFKHVPHICLQLTASSDAGCKELLTFRLAEVQHQCDVLSEQLGAERKQHADVRDKLEDVHKKMVHAQHAAAEDMQRVMEKHDAAMEQVQHKAAAALEAAQAELQGVKDAAQTTQVTLQQALDESRAARVKQDVVVQELQHALATEQRRAEAAHAEANALRDALQRQSAANELLASQLREAVEKREAAAVMAAQYEQQAVQLKVLQEQVEVATKEARVLQSEKDGALQDAQRLNDVLSNTQTKLQVLTEKQCALEESVGSLRQQVQQQTARADHAEAARDAAQDAERATAAQREQLQHKLQEAEAMIGWLNKQVNTVQMGGAFVRPRPVERERVVDSGHTSVTIPALRSKAGRMLAGQVGGGDK